MLLVMPIWATSLLTLSHYDEPDNYWFTHCFIKCYHFMTCRPRFLSLRIIANFGHFVKYYRIFCCSLMLTHYSSWDLLLKATVSSFSNLRISASTTFGVLDVLGLLSLKCTSYTILSLKLALFFTLLDLNAMLKCLETLK